MNLWGFKKKQLYKGDNGGLRRGSEKARQNGDRWFKGSGRDDCFRKNEDGLDDVLGDCRECRRTGHRRERGQGRPGEMSILRHRRNQTPRLAQSGEIGEAKVYCIGTENSLPMSGIIGYPNVGKSSLLALSTAAKPRLRNYPFTPKNRLWSRWC